MGANVDKRIKMHLIYDKGDKRTSCSNLASGVATTQEVVDVTCDLCLWRMIQRAAGGPRQILALISALADDPVNLPAEQTTLLMVLTGKTRPDPF